MGLGEWYERSEREQTTKEINKLKIEMVGKSDREILLQILIIIKRLNVLAILLVFLVIAMAL